MPYALTALWQIVLYVALVILVAVILAVVAWWVPRGQARHHRQVSLMEQRRRAWGSGYQPDDGQAQGPPPCSKTGVREARR